jgi:hypothetical protein
MSVSELISIKHVANWHAEPLYVILCLNKNKLKHAQVSMRESGLQYTELGCQGKLQQSVGSTWVNITTSLNTRDRTCVHCSTGLCSRPNGHNTKFNMIFIVFTHILTTSKNILHIKFLVYHYVVHVLCLFPLPSETLIPTYQTTCHQTSEAGNCAVWCLNTI